MKSGLKEWKIKAIFSYPTSDSPKKLQIPCKVKQFLWLWLKEWKVSPRVYRQWRTKCLKSLEWAERCSGETNEDKVNWQEESSRKAGKILPGFLAGLCPRGQQGSLSVPQRDPNPKLCLGGIRSTRDGVQIFGKPRSPLYIKFFIVILYPSSTPFTLYTLDYQEAGAHTGHMENLQKFPFVNNTGSSKNPNELVPLLEHRVISARSHSNTHQIILPPFQ